MKYAETEIIKIAESYKKQFSLNNKIVSTRFYPKFNDAGNYWIVTGEFEQFGEIQYFFYMISNETGQLIQTMNEHGVNPHLPIEISDEELKREWDEFDEDEHNRKNYYKLIILKVCYENKITTSDYLEEIFLKLGIITQIGDVIAELKNNDLLENNGLFENETSVYKSLRITETGIQYLMAQTKYFEIDEDLFSKETEEKLIDFFKN